MYYYLDYHIIAIKCAAVMAKIIFVLYREEQRCQLSGEGIMEVLKDHVSYLLIPEMKVYRFCDSIYTEN